MKHHYSRKQSQDIFCLKRADSHYCRDQGPENNFSKWSDVCVCNLETRHFVCSVVFVLFWNDSLCLSGEPGGPDNDDDATTQDIWYCSIYLILTIIRYFHINYVKTIVIYNSFRKFLFSFHLKFSSWRDGNLNISKNPIRESYLSASWEKIFPSFRNFISLLPGELAMIMNAGYLWPASFFLFHRNLLLQGGSLGSPLATPLVPWEPVAHCVPAKI